MCCVRASVQLLPAGPLAEYVGSAWEQSGILASGEGSKEVQKFRMRPFKADSVSESVVA